MAVVARASEIPPATAPKSGGLRFGDAAEGVDNADDRAEQPHEGSRGTDRRQAAKSALQLGMDDGLGALQGAARSFDLLAGSRDRLDPELLQAGGDDLRQMALLVALGNLDGLVDLAFAQGAGDRGGEHARLLAGGAVSHGAVDHDAD